MGSGRQAFQQAGGFFRQRVVETGLADQVQRRQACSHGHRVTGQGAGLVDRPQRCQMLHDGLLAAKGAHRHAAPDNLAQGGHVRGDAVMALGAAQRYPETAHDFIENQHRAVVVTLLAQGLQEILGGGDTVHVAGHRLHDDGGDVVAVFFESLGDAGGIVVVQHQGVGGDGFRYAGGAGGAGNGDGAGAGFHQQAVHVPVVATFKLDDLVAAGVAAGQADGAHGGFGAGVDHAHHVHGGHQFADLVGHGHFGGGGGAETQAFLYGRLHGGNHVGVVMAQDHGAPGAHVIDVLIVVFVEQVRATGGMEEHRCAADAFERPHRGIHTAGNVFLGLTEKLFRVLAAHGVSSVESILGWPVRRWPGNRR